MHAVLGGKLVYRTVDAMWRAAGDTSTDFNFYTKRGILAGVYGSTAMRWFNDTSEDEKPTEEFLAARIENVMQFEKFKTKAKEALSNFPVCRLGQAESQNSCHPGELKLCQSPYQPPIADPFLAGPAARIK